ncbi:unnamed protein product, partial [Ectocarpus fasciculatus]
MPWVIPATFCRRNSSPWSIRDANVTSGWCAPLLLSLLLLVWLLLLVLMLLMLLMLRMLTLQLLLLLMLLAALFALLSVWWSLLLPLVLSLPGFPMARSSHARGETDCRGSGLGGGVIAMLMAYPLVPSTEGGVAKEGDGAITRHGEVCVAM